MPAEDFCDLWSSSDADIVSNVVRLLICPHLVTSAQEETARMYAAVEAHQVIYCMDSTSSSSRVTLKVGKNCQKIGKLKQQFEILRRPFFRQNL